MELNRKYWILSILLLCIASCSATGVYYPEDRAYPSGKPADPVKEQVFRDNVGRLAKELMALNADVDEAEAALTAETVIRDAAILAREYKLVRPAILHNLLIQIGLKKRGLCYQWTEDLMKSLKALNLRTLVLNWGVADRGSDLFEHNCVVVTARGADFNQGLVLDAWRNSGVLYWASVTKDNYPWKQLPPSKW